MMRRKKIGAVIGSATLVILIAALAYRLGLRNRRSPDSSPVTSARQDGGCLDVQSAGAHTGENSCVSGRVLRVFTSRSGNTFLDFCSDYRHCAFTSIIFAPDRSKFGNLAALEGREVEIRGEITSYQGRAEIIIRKPGQVRAVP